MCDDAESSPGHVSESGDDSDDDSMGSDESDSRYDLNDGFIVPDDESDEGSESGENNEGGEAGGGEPEDAEAMEHDGEEDEFGWAPRCGSIEDLLTTLERATTRVRNVQKAINGTASELEMASIPDECCCCYDDRATMLENGVTVHNCGHVLCSNCWESVHKVECPTCKSGVWVVAQHPLKNENEMEQSERE